MPINVHCPECDYRFVVDSEYAGRPGRCPECGNRIDVPAAPATPREADPNPYYTGHHEVDEDLPRPSRRVPREESVRLDYGEAERGPSVADRTFDAQLRADRWRKTSRGLGYVQIAIVLAMLSQVLPFTLTLARGEPLQVQNEEPDAGQIALGIGAMILMLGTAMFVVLGRVGCLRVPYVPARGPAKASLIMTLCAVFTTFATFCTLFMFAFAAAQAGMVPGAPPPPDALVFMLMFMGCGFLTVALGIGGEVASLVSMGRIGGALHDPDAAGWAHRSIVALLAAIGVTLLGFCGLVIYLMPQVQAAQQQQQAQQQAANGPAGAKPPLAEKANDGKLGGKGAAPPAGPAQPQAPPQAVEPPMDETATIIAQLILVGPFFLYLIHYSVALQKCRRVIRHEVERLTGQGGRFEDGDRRSEY